MKANKTIALVAHDCMKTDMVDWARKHAKVLCQHRLICTGTTGGMILEMFQQEMPGVDIDITLLKSGPLGGDQQLGALISSQEIDFLVFLTDPMTSQPHDVDVKALIRIAVIYNILMASNLTSADFAISSTLFDQEYTPVLKDYKAYLNRQF